MQISIEVGNSENFICLQFFEQTISQDILFSPLTLFRMGFFGATHGWEGGRQKGVPPENLSHISFNVET